MQMVLEGRDQALRKHRHPCVEERQRAEGLIPGWRRRHFPPQLGGSRFAGLNVWRAQLARMAHGIEADANLIQLTYACSVGWSSV